MTDTPAPNDMPDDEFEAECAEVFKDFPRLSDETKAMIKDRLAILSDPENDDAIKFGMMVFWHTLDSQPTADPRAPVAAGGESLNWKRQKDTVFAWAAEHGFTPVESEIVDLLSALQQPAAPAVDLSQIRKGAIQHGANCHGNSNIGYMFCDIFGGINAVAAVKVAERTFDYLAAQGMIKEVK